MTPQFCAFHKHWTDGACVAGKRSLTRNDLTKRLADIDFKLDDDETCQSNGYYVNKALEAEHAMLVVLRDSILGALPQEMPTEAADQPYFDPLWDRYLDGDR